MAKFVQIIEFESSRIDEIRALGEELRARGGGEGPVRATFCTDRDRPNRYVNIIEFESYEEAMENSNRPETGELAAKLAELCDGPPTFTNLDAMDIWE